MWVYQDGVTVGAGAGPGLLVDFGVGADGSSPDTDPSWGWTEAAYNTDIDGLAPGDLANDEYGAMVVAPELPGVYDFCARVSADAGRSWTYCDFGGSPDCPGGGSDDGYSPDSAGELTVE